MDGEGQHIDYLDSSYYQKRKLLGSGGAHL